MNPRPLVAVLVTRWESKSEEGWLTRQVAGALACIADVHVVTPEGTRARMSTDGPFTVHRTGTPVPRDAEARRDLLVESMVITGTFSDDPVSPDAAALVDRDLVEPWTAAGGLLATLRPDQLVIADHRNVGALAAAERGAPDAPITLVSLGTHAASLAFPHFDPLVNRARGVLAVTEAERQAIIERHGAGGTTYRIGAPMAANPSALSEPNTWVGDSDYVFVVSSAAFRDDGEEAELTRLLRLRFPDNPIGIAHTDCFCAWHHGRLNQGWAIERSSDMARLMAWARVTVDLRSGRLFARRCVESLLYGTPIIVPHDTRAREHAERGRGGLWFEDAAQLTWCVEALLDPSTREALSAQGRSYAEDEYGSTDRFIARVLAGCGLSAVPASTPVTA
ncbi:MAG: glycosyltransferase [Acidimicrobiales bacterium]